MGTKTIETTSAGGVVIGPSGKILVVSQQHGTSWSLPKGHIDPGENPTEAAKREICGESGIQQLEFIRELGNYSRYKIGKDGKDDTSELKTMIMFLFKTSQTDLKPLDPANPEARWVETEKVTALLTHPKDKEFFQSIEDQL